MLGQPAVKRSLPMIFMVGLIASAALAWFMLSTPTQKTLFSGLPDSDKSAVISALKAGGITGRLDESTDAVTVAESDYSKARMLLAGQGLPKSAPAGYAILDNLPMGTSRAVEGERLRQARETELARSIEDIDAVAEARVHLAVPENTVFVRDNAAPTASVILKLQGGRSLSDAQVASIVNLVASSVPGMKPEGVTIVDQAGALLSKPGGADGGNDARVRFQNQVEQKYRDQLTTLLTPLVGAGNFTAEVSADVNLDDTSSTRESYDKAGTLARRAGQLDRQGRRDRRARGHSRRAVEHAVRADHGDRAATRSRRPAAAAPRRAAPLPPRRPPRRCPTPPSRRTAMPAPTTSARKSRSRAPRPAGSSACRSRSCCATSKDRSRARRSNCSRSPISSARRSAPTPHATTRSPCISRKFAPAAATGGGPAFYESGWFAMIVRNVTALVIALLVLFLGVRPLAKALLKKRDDAGRGGRDLAALGDRRARRAARAGRSGSTQLESAQNFDDRIGTVRGFTRDNPARAALAVRDMIKADAK